MDIDIHTRRSSGGMEGENAGRKKVGNIGGGNSGRTIHKNERRVWGV